MAYQRLCAEGDAQPILAELITQSAGRLSPQQNDAEPRRTEYSANRHQETANNTAHIRQVTTNHWSCAAGTHPDDRLSSYAPSTGRFPSRRIDTRRPQPTTELIYAEISVTLHSAK
ncbi:hypothetical protein WG66_005998 [Moniliophthora roreri]|nr:hypothetical protein WG66_005998 [Moniliophthora roreri]